MKTARQVIARIEESILNWFICKYANPHHIQPGGNCPVEAEGILTTGEYYYFRSRGRGWTVEICSSEKDWWDGKRLFYYKESKYEWPVAGWIERWRAVRYATRAIDAYYDQKTK